METKWRADTGPPFTVEHPEQISNLGERNVALVSVASEDIH
jgi:hypothetical protein